MLTQSIAKNYLFMIDMIFKLYKYRKIIDIRQKRKSNYNYLVY